ncbi:MAG: hypothetical protein AAFO69_05425 [Bacteroidota bacterium]
MAKLAYLDNASPSQTHPFSWGAFAAVGLFIGWSDDVNGGLDFSNEEVFIQGQYLIYILKFTNIYGFRKPTQH